MDFLEQMLASRGLEREGFESPVKAMEALNLYLDADMPEVGDIVKISSFGVNAVKFPKDNQIAQVIRRFPEYMNGEDSTAYNGIIAIALSEGCIRSFAVDLRHYERADKPARNVLNIFRGRK